MSEDLRIRPILSKDDVIQGVAVCWKRNLTCKELEHAAKHGALMILGKDEVLLLLVPLSALPPYPSCGITKDGLTGPLDHQEYYMLESPIRCGDIWTWDTRPEIVSLDLLLDKASGRHVAVQLHRGKA